MKLSQIIGYRLDMARCAALRSLYRLLSDTPYRAADTTALLLIKERPGCNQTALGRALAANRSVGMKVAMRLEQRGLLARGVGRDRRTKGLYITPLGESVLADLLDRHERAEALLRAALDEEEQALLLKLLGKIEQAVLDEEAELAGGGTPARHAQASNA